MPSDKHNSIMANPTSSIFSLFDVALAQDVPFGYTVVLTFQVIVDGSDTFNWDVQHHSLATLVTGVLFIQFLICFAM